MPPSTQVHASTRRGTRRVQNSSTTTCQHPNGSAENLNELVETNLPASPLAQPGCYNSLSLLYLHFISSLLAIRFLLSSNPLLAFLLLNTSLYYSAFLLLSFSLFSLSITQLFIIQPYITQPFHYSALLLSYISTSINTLDFHL